jgi:RNA polymerase sigma-70 factor (ECF subfamily)
MGENEELSAIFCDHVAPALRSAAARLPELGDTLAHFYALAREARPEVVHSSADFVRYLAERVSGDDGLNGLEHLHATDLYLACGCVRGDLAAIAVFEREYVPVLRNAVRRARFTGSTVEEVEQILRERWLVGDGASPPRLAQYTGRGDLRNWVRVAAVREALMLLRKQGREIPARDEELAAHLAATEDPELRYLKERYSADLRAAFEAAVSQATAQDRNLLRYHYLDGLTLEQLARTQGVHRATITRWIARARDDLLERMRVRLREQLRLRESELESLMRLARSELRITLTGLLGDR